MKNLRLLILFCLSIFSVPLLAQTSTGQEQEFDTGIKNNSTQTVTSVNYLVTQGTDGTYGKIAPVNLPYLIKVSTVTGNAQAYVKNAAGTQVMYDIAAPSFEFIYGAAPYGGVFDAYAYDKNTLSSDIRSVPSSFAVSNAIAAATIPDATTTVKGKLKLVGDLGGTADLPTTPTALHKTGSESFSGKKTSTNSSTTPSGFVMINNEAASSENISSVNTNSGNGISSVNTNSGNGIQASNRAAGTAIQVLNESGATGVGVQSTSYQGSNFVANIASTGTGFNYIGRNAGVDTFTVDKLGNSVYSGNVTAATPTLPSHLVTKGYADNLVIGLLNDRGSYNASSNVFPTTGGSGVSGAIKKGDIWYINTAGTLAGNAVRIGDSFRSLADTPGQNASNWSLLSGNIGYVPENVNNKQNSLGVDATNTKYPTVTAVNSGLASGLALKPNDVDVVHKTGALDESVNGIKTFSDVRPLNGILFPILSEGSFRSSTGFSGVAFDASSMNISYNGGGKFQLDHSLITSVARTYQLPNKDGVFAMTSDLTGFANDTDVVHKTGSIPETITGLKTFSSAVVVDSGTGPRTVIGPGSFSLAPLPSISAIAGGLIALAATNDGLVVSASPLSTSRYVTLSTSSVTPSSNRIVNFPDKSGTFAMTSDIPVNPITGTGSTNFIPKFTAGGVLGNSTIVDNGNDIDFRTTRLYMGYSNLANSNNIYIEAGSITNIANIQGTKQGVGSQNIVFQRDGGNVGIGTTTPTYKTEIIKNGAGILDLLSLNNNNAVAGVLDGVKINLRGVSLESSSTYGTADGLFTIGFGSKQISLLQNGNVGIGTTNPLVPLEVKGQISASAISNLQKKLNFNWVNSDSVAVIDTYNFSTGERYPLALQPSGANVLIGTTTDNGSKLQVNGTISTTGINLPLNNSGADAIFNSIPLSSNSTIASDSINIGLGAGDCILESFKYQVEGYGMQRLTYTWSSLASRVFIRSVNGGTWTAWVEK